MKMLKYELSNELDFIQTLLNMDISVAIISRSSKFDMCFHKIHIFYGGKSV